MSSGEQSEAVKVGKEEQAAKGRILPLIASRKGEVFYEVIVKTLIVVVFLLTVINLYNVFIKYQNVNYLCKRTVRAIEVEGAVSGSVVGKFNELNQHMKLSATFEVTDVSYFDNSAKTIQLRDNFTVRVRDSYNFTIMNPLFAPPVVIPIPMEVTLTGMSEVYHKP